MRVECISTYKCLEKLWLRVSTTYALAAALTTLPARSHHFIPSAHSSQSAVFTLALSSVCHLSVPPTLPKQLNLSHRWASLRASTPSPMLTFWMQYSRSPGPAGGTVRSTGLTATADQQNLLRLQAGSLPRLHYGLEKAWQTSEFRLKAVAFRISCKLMSLLTVSEKSRDMETRCKLPCPPDKESIPFPSFFSPGSNFDREARCLANWELWKPASFLNIFVPLSKILFLFFRP